ncbi:hypothetical protein FNF29_00083 [Cafeteria roenbergensis]|uniref:Uncharacterized protein n=1 Tax=Cafeteria roenbergensis TaxID=33653 RepID=A0A5A8CYR5_CAFRO|nr:hypothetical protein FNF29_00083 [Cafeteria roenbergensis]|eukprot:KAA0157507.1 hypothetical protein FNF29_00083 [Cafeteria roenbergensis]
MTRGGRVRGQTPGVLSPLEREGLAELLRASARNDKLLKDAFPFAPHGKGSCGGGADLCKACDSKDKAIGAETELCEGIERQCRDSLCNDLCLGDSLWKCEVVGTGPWAGAVSASESKAMCAQAKAKACSDMAECCDKGEDPEGAKADSAFNGLRQWVVAQSAAAVDPGDGAAAFLTGALPMQVCRHDAVDADATSARCLACQKQMVLRFSMVDEDPDKSCRNLIPLSSPGRPPADEDDKFQGAYNRCLKVHTHLLAKRNDAASFFAPAEALCKCAGCCTEMPPSDGSPMPAECPFPDYSLL